MLTKSVDNLYPLAGIHKLNEDYNVDTCEKISGKREINSSSSYRTVKLTPSAALQDLPTLDSVKMSSCLMSLVLLTPLVIPSEIYITR